MGNKLEAQIDYENAVILDPTEDERFSITKHQKYIETLLFFDVRYNILRSENFYLNVLDKGNLIGSPTYNEDSNFVNFVKSRIVDSSKINDKVVSNIKSGHLRYAAKKDHFEFALVNNLDQSFPQIGKEIMDENLLFYNSNLLELFLEKIDSPREYLKSLCTDEKSHICWKAIKLLKEKLSLIHI